jgi:hypothetical protein
MNVLAKWLEFVSRVDKVRHHAHEEYLPEDPLLSKDDGATPRSFSL